MAVYAQVTTEDGFEWMDHKLPSGTAFNIIEYEEGSSFVPPVGTKIIPYDGREIWQLPIIYGVPQSVDSWRIKVILSKSNMPSGQSLLDAANDLAESQGGAVKIAWNNAPTISRTSSMLEALAPSLGLSPKDIDRIFVEASSFSA